MTVLESGPMRATVADGMVRDVTVGGHRVLDAIYVALRDADWNTVPATVRCVPGSGSSLVLHGEHDDGAPLARWRAVIEARDGRLSFALHGEMLRAFVARRFGVCVLHPGELAGRPFLATTPAGAVTRGDFPLLVAPRPLASGLMRLRYDIDEQCAAEISYAGAPCEIEDHRNWMDAGWKAYCPPLSTSPPRTLPAGHTFAHDVTVAIHGRPRTAVAPSIHLQDAPPGTPYQIGLARPGDLGPQLDHEYVQLSEDSHWRSELDSARGRGNRLRITVLRDSTAWLDRVARAVSATGTVVSVAVVDRTTLTTRADDVERVRRALGDARVAVGGGSLLHLAELNRLDADTSCWDFASVAATAQAHHDDSDLIMNGVAALPAMLATIRRRVPGRPIAVAPLAFRARRTPGSPPADHDPPDPRERSPLGAAWALAALAGLAGVAWVSFLVDPATPAAHLLAAARGARPMTGGGRSVAAVRVHGADRPAVLAANLRDRDTLVTVDGDEHLLAPYEVRRLADDNAVVAR